MSDRTDGPPPAPARGRTLRLFVAVPLWGEFRDRNLDRYSSLRALPHDLKWVRPELWHITLKFLGPIPESEIPKLSRTIRDAVRGTSPFEIEIDGLGGFPRLSKCRVLWAGVTKGREEMNRLARRVADACREAGHPGDRKNFQAHLTLARCRDKTVALQIPKDLFKASWGLDWVESASLVKSTLGPGGPKYEVIEVFPFAPDEAGGQALSKSPG